MQAGLPHGGGKKPTAIPALLVGGPGLAKTEIINKISSELAKKLNMEFPCETIACPQVQPETIGGLPVPNHDHKYTELFILNAGKKLARTGQGCLFFDEFSSGSDPVAAASLTAIQSGQLGDFVMPAAIARIAAMNEPEKAVQGRQLMAPESNRFCWIFWTLEFDDWADYVQGGPGALKDVVVLPNNWEADFYDEAVGIVLRFLKSFPTKHFNKEPEPSKASVAWPSPRSWLNAIRLVAACLSLGEKYTSTLIQDAVQGCVGEAAASEFNSWINNLDLPDPEEVLRQGVNFKFNPNYRDDQLAAALESVAHVATRNHPSRGERSRTAADIVMKFEKKKDIIMTAITLVVQKGLLLEKASMGGKAHPVSTLWLRLQKEIGLLNT